MANYQQRLPLRGGSPTLKELRARQLQPSPPSTQPPVSKAPGVNPQQLTLKLPEPAPAPATPPATPVPPQTGGGVRQFAGKALQFAGKAAPYVTGALVAADVVRRARTDDPRGVQRADVLANFDTRGLGPADAFLFAPKTPASEVDPRVAIHKTMQEALAKRMAERAGKPVEPDPYGLRPDRLQPSALAHPTTPGPAADPAADPEPAPAPDPAAVPQKTPEQVFADLQQQRGFSPLGGVDPNATHSPALFQRTDAIRTRPGGANPKDVQALQDYRQAGFDTAQQEVIAAQDALLLNPKDPKAQQRLAQAEAGFAEGRQALMAAQGPLERRQYAVPGGSASGVTSVNTPRGGFVGAATDTEAARNLQARFEQDAAASQIAAGYDRQTERLRDARAEKMGISRAKLDASEGRSNPLTSLFAPQQQQAAPEAFSQPGDGFGDAAMRRSALERQMADTRTSGSERRAAAEAYKGFLSPAHGTGSGGPANGHSPDLFTMVDKLRDNQRADQNLALQGQQLQETRRSNAFNQALNATKEDRAAREQFRVQGKEAEQAVVKDRTQFIKDFTDPKTKRGPDMGALDVLGAQLARSPSLQRADPAMAARFLDGSARYEDLVKARQMQRIYEESRPGLSTLYLGSPASADEIVQRYFQLNAPQL